MDTQITDLQNQIEEQQSTIEAQAKDIADLKTGLDELIKKFKLHGHSGKDDTKVLEERLRLKPGETIELGNFGLEEKTGNEDDPDVQYGYLVVGVDKDTTDGSENTQITIENQHSTTGTTNQTFMYGVRAPLRVGMDGVVSSGGTTLTTGAYEFNTNELDGAYVIVYDSATAGQFNMYEIASNTKNAITITGGTWSFSDSAARWFVFTPVYLGSADYPWRRVYTNSGVDGGVRFGTGTTGNSTNAHLYFKGSKIIYRYKDGATTRYKYLDLATTGVTWVHTTTAP